MSQVRFPVTVSVPLSILISLFAMLVMGLLCMPPAQAITAQGLMVKEITQLQHPSENDAQNGQSQNIAAAQHQLASLEQQNSDLAEQIEAAPQTLARLQTQLHQWDNQPAPSLDENSISGLSLDTLENRLIDSFNALEQLQQAFGDANRQVTVTQMLPDRAQVQIASLQNQLQQVRRSLSDNADGLTKQESELYTLQSRILQQQLELNQQQLINNPQLRDLAMAQRDLAARKLDQGQQEIQLLQKAVAKKRSQLSRETAQQAAAGASGKGPSNLDNPLVRTAVEDNSHRADQLITVTNAVNRMIQESINVRSQLDTVQQIQSNLNDQVAAVRGSVLLSMLLRQQRDALPPLVPRPRLSDQIANIRLQQFNLMQQREALSDIGNRVSQQIAQAAAKSQGRMHSTPQLTKTLGTLYSTQRSLLDQLDREYGSLLTLSIDTQLNQQQLNQLGNAVRARIDEQLFWIASGQPLGWTWVKQLPHRLKEELMSPSWRHGLEDLFEVPSLWTVCVLPMIVLLIALSVFRPRIQRHLYKLQSQVGHIRRDTQWHTPQAILLNLVLSIRGPLLMASVGVGLRLSGSTGGFVLGGALLTAAFAWGYFSWARRLLLDRGVASHHFHWPVSYVRRLRVLITQLGIASVPVVLVIYVIQHMGTSLVDQPIPLLIVLVGYVAMSVLLAKIIMAHVPEIGARLFRLLLGILLSLVPLFLAALIIAGFEYTAVRLTPRFITTIYLLGLWVMVESAVVRGLAVAARRLKFRRALDRRRSQTQSQSNENSEPPEEPPLDMDQVNKQSLRLSKMVLVLIFIGFFYIVWHDLLGVLSFLKTVDLWQVDQAGASGTQVENISLGSVCMAIITLGLTWFMSRNLPGMLEVMVLSRLKLKAGMAYALSALLSYTILGVGIVLSLGMLGLTWAKLQWLIAALGVGLGFGLQEIFANFISGLIILFERPVRIGDTITLNQMDGTVSRIRIRATTVVDFDNKEMIIPNKTFITDRLINWSLSDNITRIVMIYSISQAEDTETVRRMLLDIANDNPRVRKEPETTAFCMSADSESLKFELRVYVSEISERLPVRDEINRKVSEAFKAQGIRIAFQQMDVWLHNSQGESRRVESKKAEDDSGLSS